MLEQRNVAFQALVGSPLMKYDLVVFSSPIRTTGAFVRFYLGGGNISSGDGSTLITPPGPNASDQEVLRTMYYRDSEFRRTEAVVDWLQGAMSARSGPVDLEGRGMGMGMRGGHAGWSNTLESLAVAGGQKSEVGQMHPDANLRKVGHGRGDGDAGLKVMRLVGQDDLDEEELLRTTWLLMRTGKLGDAMRLCESRGQPWRAAAMGGGGVIGTGVLKGKTGDQQDDDEGEYCAAYSPGQGLWQEMCWQLRCVRRRTCPVLRETRGIGPCAA